MEYLAPVALSSSWRPSPLIEEVDLRNVDNVSIHLENANTIVDDVFLDTTLLLTNFRIVLIVPAPVAGSNGRKGFNAWAIALGDISRIEDCNTFFSRSKRVRIHFNKRLRKEDLSIKFNLGDKDDFIEACNRALSKRSWEKVRTASTMVAASSQVVVTTRDPNKIQTHSEPSEAESFSSSNAGIGGIIRRQEKALQSADALAKSAMTDLDALINQARQVVDVVQRYAAYMQESREKREHDDALSETSTQLAEANEMENILQSIGIVSPVTRLSAGRRFHEQLARQLVDMFLEQNRLQRLGGMITLTDVYCVYNRARGTELVSPHDLLCACEKMHALSLGLRLREFPSGVKVLELDGLDEAEFCQRLAEFAGDAHHRETGICASDVAVHFGYSLLLAKEKLLIAEQRRCLCRDESLRGLYFFENRFPDYVCSYRC